MQDGDINKLPKRRHCYPIKCPRIVHSTSEMIKLLTMVSFLRMKSLGMVWGRGSGQLVALLKITTLVNKPYFFELNRIESILDCRFYIHKV